MGRAQRFSAWLVCGLVSGGFVRGGGRSSPRVFVATVRIPRALLVQNEVYAMVWNLHPLDKGVSASNANANFISRK
jgi:hypothetical protein